jgi:hypothetical protein
MQQHGFRRWKPPPNGARDLVCVGDSITYDRAMLRTGIRRNWVEQVATRLDEMAGDGAPRPGDGFRGMWRDEWKRHGRWTQIATSDILDLAPFRQGYLSTGRRSDRLEWRKPAALTVAGFDLYWIDAPGMGDWQFRTDDGDWQNIGPPAAAGVERTGSADAKLHRRSVDGPVEARVEIRAFDGRTPCGAAVVGIAPVRSDRAATSGTVVHNLGHAHQMLAAFCRDSAGDPLAVLDVIRPQLITVLFTNDVRLHDAERFGRELGGVVERVDPYADVVLIAPFEQRAPRRVDDARTTAGSEVVTSASAIFLASDSGTRVSGASIPAGTAIASVQSTEVATLTTAATGTSAAGELAIEGRRDAEIQAAYRAITRELAATRGCAFVDLYEAWSATVGPGWDAAYAAGLMVDGLHPSQLGHDDIAARVMQALGIAQSGSPGRPLPANGSSG